MDTKRMLKMADKIEKLPHIKNVFAPDETLRAVSAHNARLDKLLNGKRKGFFFNLSQWRSHVWKFAFKKGWGAERKKDCGTAGCIAGAVVHFAKLGENSSNISHDAAEYLGLNFEEADTLFAPNLFDADDDALSDVTPKQAARAMRLMASGKHPWADQGFEIATY